MSSPELSGVPEPGNESPPQNEGGQEIRESVDEDTAEELGEIAVDEALYNKKVVESIEREKDVAWEEHRPSSSGAETPPDEVEPEEPPISIPADILDKAKRQGIDTNFLRIAEHDPYMADALRRKGIEWGATHPPAEATLEHRFRDVPSEELTSAEHTFGVKVTPDNVRFARLEANRGNLRPADYLAGVGVDIGVERLNPPDPVIKKSEIGRRRGKAIAAVIKEIERNPGAVRRSLRRPGRLPLGLDLLPVIGQPLGKRLLALRIVRRVRRDMSIELKDLETELENLRQLGVRNEPQQSRMESLPKRIKDKQEEVERAGFRWYRNKYQRYHNYLDNLDDSVKSHRKRLGRSERSLVFGEAGATLRRNLASRVFDTRLSLEELEHMRIIDMGNPEFVHNHEQFKEDLKKFQDSLKVQRSVRG